MEPYPAETASPLSSDILQPLAQLFKTNDVVS